MSLDTIKNLKHWTSHVEVEQSAMQQLRNLAAMPILAGHVAVMPDVHMGTGAAVGTVIPTRAAIIPSAVGVDIGCGMAAVRTTLKASDLPDSLSGIRSAIEAVVPVGFQSHSSAVRTLRDGLNGVALERTGKALAGRYESLRILKQIGRHDHSRTFKQLCSLGGGNHFIEICLDEINTVWVMLHSGSRYIGKTIGETAISMAREEAFTKHRKLPDMDLAWLDEGTPSFDAYVEGMQWAQDYAAHNRALMLHAVLKVLRETFGRDVATADHAVNCHHNYTEVMAGVEAGVGGAGQIYITRKGAVSARAGELGIIPGSMGAKSFIVRGKGNSDAYCSCSHGAGRRLSRGAAKRAFSLADLASQTEGVECRKDEGVLDEIPGAYKDIDAVMASQAELVDIVHTLKQVMCIKG